MGLKLFKKRTAFSISFKHLFIKKNDKLRQTGKLGLGTLSDFELHKALILAKEEWELSKDCFNEATIPEMIDGAIYKMMSSLEYYQYLIRLAKCNFKECSSLQTTKSSKKEDRDQLSESQCHENNL